MYKARQEIMELSAMSILSRSLSRCILATVDTVELMVGVCSRLIEVTHKTTCSSFPILAGYGLHHAFMFSILALFLISFVLWFRSYRRTHHHDGVSSKFSPQQWNAIFDLAKTAHIDDHACRLMTMIEAGHVDVNAHTDSHTGLTLLLCACLSGHLKLAKFLIEKGADTSSLTHDGDTPLLLATYATCTCNDSDNESSGDLIDLLACRGVNVNARNKHGDSALSIAAVYGRTHLITMLLDYGADPSIPSSSGYLPVVFAGHSGNLKAARLLENQSWS